jgi:hypothetical protein
MHITPLLPEDQLLPLPLIRLAGTMASDPAAYTGLQNMLLPYMDTIHLVWWICLAVTVGYLLVRFVVRPLWHGVTPLPIIATPPAEKNGFMGFYYRCFSIHEIEHDAMVRWFGGAILLGFLVTFDGWQMDPMLSAEGNASCWPFFQQCRDWAVLHVLPNGYSQTLVFMVLFSMIVAAAYALCTQRFMAAHALIAGLLIGKAYFTLLNFGHSGNYDYYHTVFTIVFLFLPHKRFFASLSVVALYALSTVAKIHPAWTFGLYFTSLQRGLPVFGNALAPLMSNLVMFMEMVMAWFLFSHHRWLQRGVFVFFCLFHIYSGILVGYHYPTMVMPALVVCFGGLFRPFAAVPLDKKSLPGWLLIALLGGLQSISLFIPGDAKLTLEGNYYGLYMFESNHQCQITVYHRDGSVVSEESRVNARFRCNPWEFLSRMQQSYCAGPAPEQKRLTIIHSINGGPFYAIVDAPDLCSLHYAPFAHNDWIKDAATAPIVGRPAKNYYR